MPSAQGVEIATWDLGGSGPPLVLSHATGFHSRMWTPLAPVLAERHHVWAFDHRGHGSSGHAPDGRYDDWDLFADDLLAVVDALRAASVIDSPTLSGAGHSMGAAILLLAQQRRPGLFASLYCYEPIMSPTPAAPEAPMSAAPEAPMSAAPEAPMSAAPEAPMSAAPEAPASNHLSAVSLRRRETFDSLAAARANFQAKRPFALFSPAALDAYIAGAFESRANGSVGLCCRPAEESSVYKGASRHHAFAHLVDVDIGVTVACGEGGGDLGMDLMADIADRLPLGRLEVTEGCSHFGPMEAPEQVARAIIRALAHPTGRQR